MLNKLLSGCGIGLVWVGIAVGQVVTYEAPALLPSEVPVSRTTYYAPSISVPATTYYAPQTVYYAAPRPSQRVSYYNSSVSSMPVGSVPYDAPATVAPIGAQTVDVLEPPVVAYRPVVTTMRPVIVQQPVVVQRPVVVQQQVFAAPVVTYRPVMVAPQPVYYAPQPYVVTRGLFGRPRYYPVNPGAVYVAPAYFP